jgi:hypothetical protein
MPGPLVLHMTFINFFCSKYLYMEFIKIKNAGII